MKQLDLTKIDVLYFAWLSAIVKQVKPKEILITQKQSKEVFSAFFGEPHTDYRGIPLKIKKEPK